MNHYDLLDNSALYDIIKKDKNHQTLERGPAVIRIDLLHPIGPSTGRRNSRGTRGQVTRSQVVQWTTTGFLLALSALLLVGLLGYFVPASREWIGIGAITVVILGTIAWINTRYGHRAFWTAVATLVVATAGLTLWNWSAPGMPARGTGAVGSGSPGKSVAAPSPELPCSPDTTDRGYNYPDSQTLKPGEELGIIITPGHGTEWWWLLPDGKTLAPKNTLVVKFTEVGKNKHYDFTARADGVIKIAIFPCLK